MVWQPASDDIAVAGYEVFLNGVSQTKTSATAITLTGLDCETWFTVGIEALTRPQPLPARLPGRDDPVRLRPPRRRRRRRRR